MATTPRPTPATLGVKIFERCANDIVVAKEEVKQVQILAKQDIGIMHSELEGKQKRIHAVEEQLQAEEHMISQSRARSADLLGKLQREAEELVSVKALQAKMDQTVATMNARIDHFEGEAHKMRELEEKCEKLNASSEEWRKKYDESSQRYDKLFDKYDKLYERHELCPN